MTRTRWILRTFVIILVACGGQDEKVALSIPRGINSGQTFPAQDAPELVSLRPETDAQEVAPGVYVKILKAAEPTAIPLEKGADFLFIETIYDQSGREAATTVPSTRWSLLHKEHGLGLAAMRSGEHRLVWRCPAPTAPCEVESIQVFALPAGRPN